MYHSQTVAILVNRQTKPFIRGVAPLAVAHVVFVLTIVFALVALRSNGQADEIFSNFGPNDIFFPGGSLVWKNTTGGIIEMAGQFTVPAGADPWTFNSLDVPFASILNETNDVSMRLMTDNGGLPVTILEQMPLGGITSTPTIFNVASSQNTSLVPGTSYWIAASPTTISTQGVIWHANPLGQFGRALHRANANFGWQFQTEFLTPAMRISGTREVPEPNAALLAVLGPLGSLLTRRGR